MVVDNFKLVASAYMIAKLLCLIKFKIFGYFLGCKYPKIYTRLRSALVKTRCDINGMEKSSAMKTILCIERKK